MPVRPPPGTRLQPVHAFRPSNGTFVGTAGVAVVVVVVLVVLFTERSATGLRVALSAAIAGMLVWMALLRPRVTAYADTLLLRNMASDTLLPLARVENVVVRHTLNVWVDDRRYTCPGIGRSTRTMLRSQRRGTAESVDYASFVESTIEDLARSARRDHQRDHRGDPAPVQREWACPELAVLVVLVLALAVSFAF